MKDYYTNCNVKMPRKLEIVRNVFAQIELGKDAKILDVGGISSYYDILKAIFQTKDVYLSNINFMDVKDVKNSIVGDATQLPFKDETFDVVTSFDLIEHLINPDDFLAEAFRVLKRGGKIVISTPNLADFYSRITFLFGYTPFSYDSSKFRIATPFSLFESNRGHKSVFTYKGLKQLLPIYEFKVIRTEGYCYCDRFYLSIDPGKRKREVGFNRFRGVLDKLLPKSMREGVLFICRKERR